MQKQDALGAYTCASWWIKSQVAQAPVTNEY